MADMKKMMMVLATLAALALGGLTAAWAGCTSNLVLGPGGQLVSCVVCCTGNVCTTICY
jgi:hypothetical protein